MNVSPYLSSWFSMPLTSLSREDLYKITQTLTISKKGFGDEVPEEIEVFRKGDKFIHLPIDWALSKFKVPFTDNTIKNLPITDWNRKFIDFNHPKAVPGQIDLYNAWLDGIQNNYTFFGKAATGSGKTVVSLAIASTIKQKTIVLVHLKRLAYQWKEEAIKHFGLKEEEIGYVFDGEASWKDKKLVIGLYQSVSKKDYGEDFYKNFGYIIFDEVHKVAASTFSKSLGKFPARYKLALTATDKRRDKTENIYKYYFGEPTSILGNKALECSVVSVEYKGGFVYGDLHAIKVNALAKDDKRNEMLCNIIYKAWKSGRKILVVSERINHLQTLLKKCYKLGIPRNEMGQFTGEYYTGKLASKWSKPESLKIGKYYNFYNSGGKPFIIQEGEAIKLTRVLTKDLCEVSTKTLHNIKIQTKDVKILTSIEEKKKIPDNYLDEVKKTSNIIFATYSMITEGIDIPRLDCGIDATPRATCEQLVGRIRRPLPDKPTPIWYTIKDMSDGLFLGYYNARMREYSACNCKLFYYIYDNQEKQLIKSGK